MVRRHWWVPILTLAAALGYTARRGQAKVTDVRAFVTVRLVDTKTAYCWGHSGKQWRE